jgi:hypothetical protein
MLSSGDVTGGWVSERFWDEVAPFRAEGRLDEGTMFGFRCVRAGKDFVAMPGHESDGMVVKLPADRVSELVASGRGTVVAPAGRTFREWVEVSAEEDWGPYLEEALAFATG